MIRPVAIVLRAVLLVTLVGAEPVGAVPSAQTGDRVRATLIAQPAPRVVGTLLSYRTESITLAAEPDSAESTLARASIERLEISTGMHSNAGRGAKLGAAAGFFTLGAVGAVAGGAAYDNPVPWFVLGPIYGVLGALAGAGVGAVIGANSEHEGWERVRVPR